VSAELSVVPQVFDYESSTIRVFDISGERVAIAGDICAALDLKDVTSSLRVVQPGDKMTLRRSDTPHSMPGIWSEFAPQVQMITLITENGATDLVLESRKPEARAFRRWLTHVVWPSIRETGSYSVAPAIDLSDPIAAIEEANNRCQKAVEIAKAERARRIEAEDAQRELECAVERDRPLVAKANAHTASTSVIHRQEFAREVQAWSLTQGIEIRQQQVFDFLAHIGLFIRRGRSDAGHATADAIKRALAFTEKDVAATGFVYATGKLTAKGQDLAWRRITAHVAEHGNLELLRGVAS
jgi:prophage antirepressor-like protein